MEKTVTDAIEYRRSIRKFNPKKDLDINIVKKCIINATLAPTSSNPVSYTHLTLPTSR